MTTTAPEPVDEAAVEAFAGHLMALCTDGLLAYLIDIGDRTGLFEAALAGPATSDDLARRAGLQERYVREWLGAMVTSGILEYDPTDATYRLPAAHAACLTGGGAMDLAPMARMVTHLGRHIDEITTAFRHGGGVPYEQFRPEFTDVMDAATRGLFDELLVEGYLPLAPGLADALTAGVRMADVACGTGHSLVVLGSAFPASSFVGFDIDEGSVEQGRREAADLGLGNVRFEACDVARLRVENPFDAVMVFNAIHDQVEPAAVLRAVHDALVPGGTFLMSEPRVSSNLEDNLGHPMAPFVYAVSTLHCLTVSLAHGGAGLGTAWGEQLALRMLADAGFGPVTVHEAPGDPGNGVFVTHRPGS